VSSGREKILVIEPEESSRQVLVELLGDAGYDVIVAGSGQDGFEAASTAGVDLLILDADVSQVDCCDVLTRLKGSAATQDIRVVLLASGGAAERARALDLGADDVASPSCEPAELLARIRAQLRTRRSVQQMRERLRLSEESQEIAQTAFQALAVTEKMKRDAFSLGRALKIGVSASFLVVLVMAGIFFLFSRRAVKETTAAYGVIAQLERGLSKQEDLLARARKTREEMDRAAAGSLEEQRRQLEKQSAELQAQMGSARSEDVAALRRQIRENETRVKRLESEGKIAQNIIRSYAPSVCLLHVVVAFRHKETGRRLRYAGLNPQGEPLQDSEGNPIFDLEGRGPEVLANFFGTGFLVAGGGRILTNRHVVEPWWKNDELNAVTQQGFEPEISEISSYFPDMPHASGVEIQKISPDQDLAIVRGDSGELNRSVPAMDSRSEAAGTGQSVVLLGYPTGLDAILARAGDEMVRSIVTSSGGSPKQIVEELARRGLIRPISTQGHIGDVLPDKIVYDAQTTSGGSGGPLFNAEGKVIGVNYGVVAGFGGSNFGIPIRYAEPLLPH